MKKVITILFLVLLVSCEKEVFSPDLTKELSIQSTSNGATYKIKVALPQNYSPTTQKYDAIYVLDGEENFNFVAQNCNKLSGELGTSNALVIAIGYGNDRAVDYTPVVGGGGAVEGGGGAEKFMLFIKNELIPEIENEYSVDTTRISRAILGHSFGGLFGAYAFSKYNMVFGNYILLSPSLWYEDEVVFKIEKGNRIINKNNTQLVFLGLGEMENSGQMLAPFVAFFQVLQKNYPGIKIMSHLEPHLNHRGSENPNLIEGLKFYFKNR